MTTSRDTPDEVFWRCLYCKGRLLASGGSGLHCKGCGREYPVVAEIPILVREPMTYLGLELDSLRQGAEEATKRIDLLKRIGAVAGLPDVTVERNRDVFQAERAQAEAFLALLGPASTVLDELNQDHLCLRDAQHRGWTVDKMIPYLLRDWTDSPEMQAVRAKIGAAIERAFPEASDNSIVFAGCGAGGLLAGVSPGFAHVFGFDLALPTLAAARKLLNGEDFDLVLPRILHKEGHVTLQGTVPRAQQRVVLLAMDALETAFGDGSVDCVTTIFLTDLMPDPRRLAREIHRILRSGGVWLNYGPSGNAKSLWRFDRTEGTSFFEASGFTVIEIEEIRTTNLDVSRDFPALNSRNVMCSLVSARKTTPARQDHRPARPEPASLLDVVPMHLPKANLTYRLGVEQARGVIFQCEWIPGQVDSFEISGNEARLMGLVDGRRTIREIANLRQKQEQNRSGEETMRAFATYFDRGLLSWRDPDT